MENMNAIVDQLVEDIEIAEDVPVMYEVWAIGYDEEDQTTEAELLISAFENPDEAVNFASGITTVEVLAFADNENYFGFDDGVHTIRLEVETVVASAEDGTMNIGTIYKKILNLFEEVPDYICLSRNDYKVIEETGLIQIPCSLLKGYNKNDIISVVFTDEAKQWPIDYKIIFKTTSDYYICDFV